MSLLYQSVSGLLHEPVATILKVACMKVLWLFALRLNVHLEGYRMAYSCLHALAFCFLLFVTTCFNRCLTMCDFDGLLGRIPAPYWHSLDCWRFIAPEVTATSFSECGKEILLGSIDLLWHGCVRRFVFLIALLLMLARMCMLPCLSLLVHILFYVCWYLLWKDWVHVFLLFACACCLPQAYSMQTWNQKIQSPTAMLLLFSIAILIQYLSIIDVCLQITAFSQHTPNLNGFEGGRGSCI